MEFWTTLREAELNLFVMSGSGLGAVLLALVALAIVLRSRRDENLSALFKYLPSIGKRNDRTKHPDGRSPASARPTSPRRAIWHRLQIAKRLESWTRIAPPRGRRRPPGRAMPGLRLLFLWARSGHPQREKGWQILGVSSR